MNEKLVFVCKWDKIREKTWSYTSYSVYKELLKYFKVIDFDVDENILQKIKRKITKRLSCYDFQYHILDNANKKFEKIYQKNRIKVFQFAEMPISEYTENYIYQDLSIEYLLQCKKSNGELYNFSGFNNISEKYLYKRMKNQQIFYSKCKAIFTMGQWLADYMISECNIPKEKVHAVGAGINICPADINTSQKEGNKILFVGRDFERKGGPLVLKAFKILKEKYMKEAQLYVIGPNTNPLSAKTEGIHFLGELSRKEVSDFFNLCDIFCMPSYFEAYGIVFAEALCYGLPCIGRNRFAMKEIIKENENGHLINEDNDELLAKMMFELLKNEDMKQKLIEQKEEYIKYYSWKRVVCDIKKVIEL